MNIILIEKSNYRFQKKGIDVGVSDEELNGLPVELSSSEDDEEEEDEEG